MYQGTALALIADKLVIAVAAGKGIRALSAMEIDSYEPDSHFA
jgi:hypothetical protein